MQSHALGSKQLKIVKTIVFPFSEARTLYEATGQFKKRYRLENQDQDMKYLP